VLFLAEDRRSLLRTLGGLTTDEIAGAFLVPERTMAQRLTRARRKIKAAEFPSACPHRSCSASASTRFSPWST
jgi:predicted RNA polymerase sigma factor